MDIDWGALLKVALVSFAFGVGIVAVFSAGVLATVRVRHEDGTQGSQDQVTFGSQSSAVHAVSMTTAVVCFAACGAALLYGLYLIIPQLH